MKKVFFLMLVFCAMEANGQNYLIAFAGAGASTSVSTVKVENLTAGSTLTINGSDLLRLNVITGIKPIETARPSDMKIYPNPMNTSSVLRFSPSSAGKVIFSVLDMAGRLVYQASDYLDNTPQEFRLSGLKSGFYLISVKGSSFHYSGRILSNSKEYGSINMEKINTNQTSDGNTVKPQSKGVFATIDMDYTTGDILKFTGRSGIYSTVKMSIPASDLTITFNFTACTDGDNNNYSIVEIGSQLWMAENLKTTRYNDGTDIPFIQDANTWIALSSPGFCWYDNDSISFKSVYGALYNWYAANNNKLCPAGWHVPAEPELALTITNLGGTGVAGGKMKETGTSHWYSPNTGSTNLSGFTGLPGGFRSSVNNDGIFDEIGITGEWWTTTVSSNTYPYSLYMDYWYEAAIWETNLQTVGFSVRCIKN